MIAELVADRQRHELRHTPLAPHVERGTLKTASRVLGQSRGGTLQQLAGLSAVASAIELSLAPAFLLSATAAMVGVMTSRLGRIVDRTRQLSAEVEARPESSRATVYDELRTLSKRAKLISRAITLSVLAALLICAIVAALFINTFLERDTARLIAWGFAAAMIAFFVALLMFLREIMLATRAFRIELPRL